MANETKIDSALEAAFKAAFADGFAAGMNRDLDIISNLDEEIDASWEDEKHVFAQDVKICEHRGWEVRLDFTLGEGDPVFEARLPGGGRLVDESLSDLKAMIDAAEAAFELSKSLPSNVTPMRRLSQLQRIIDRHGFKPQGMGGGTAALHAVIGGIVVLLTDDEGSDVPEDGGKVLIGAYDFDTNDELGAQYAEPGEVEDKLESVLAQAKVNRAHYAPKQGA